MQPSIARPKYDPSWLIPLIFLLLCRLLAMYFIPLNDTTEARYAEIARKMLETGNWITPMHDYGVPFWAKPPLSFWFSALSMKVFGVNAFAARLPSFILSMGVLSLVYAHAKKWGNATIAKTAVLILLSSVAFLLDAGAVMTDPALLFCTTLSLIAFFHCVTDHHKTWGYVFFLGLGFGLLAKGPLIAILTGVPIFSWITFHRQWQNTWSSVPWIKGSLIMLLIALPWYVLAEIRTPGFLNYFIIGEHIGRFLEHGWQGDKYGAAHYQPYGMIWIYALIGILPWTGAGFTWLRHHIKKIPNFCKAESGWTSYWLLALLLPLLFFTVAKNIIWPYVLPSIPPFALLFASFSERTHISSSLKKLGLWIASSSGLIFLIATFLFIIQPSLVFKITESGGGSMASPTSEDK